jgi:hypothetical protein|tara:strand:+ start:18041 stop:18169 length:129 start_codon:yes stop_codon:yes gene_type:complete
VAHPIAQMMSPAVNHIMFYVTFALTNADNNMLKSLGIVKKNE